MKSHGKYLSPVYRTWACIIQRCQNPKHKAYLKYKNRKVCKRWESFENFYEDMGDRPFPEATIDRINNALGYSKKNCRWATRKEQASNTSRNRYLTFQGIRLHLSGWAERLNIKPATIYDRYYAGKTVEQILRTP